MKYRYHIYFLLNITATYYFIFIYNLNSGAELNLLLAFYIHSTALLLSINLLKILRLPFSLPFSLFGIVTYVFSPALTDFKLFQLGVFESNVLFQFNLGFLLFYSIYFMITYGRQHNKKKVSFYYNLNLERLHLLLFSLYLLQIFVDFSINGIDEIIKLYAIGIFFYGFIKNKNGWFQNLILICILVYEVITTIIGGLIFPLVYLGIFIVTITYIFGHFNKRVLFVGSLTLVLLVSFSVVFTPVKMQFRSADLTGKGTIERLIFAYDLILERNQTTGKTEDEDYRNTLWRLSYPLSALSMVEKKTPAIVPFWDGESYTNLVYKFIPRFIWKDKPKENSGQEFGHRYFILDDTDKSTSMNTPLLAEAYMNYGYFGIVTILFFMALLMSNFSFSGNFIGFNINYDSLEYVLSGINICMAAIFFTQWESNMSMLVGKLIILKATEILVHWLYFRKQFI